MHKDKPNEREYIQGKKNYYWHSTDDSCNGNNDSNMCDTHHCTSKCHGCHGPLESKKEKVECCRDGFTSKLRGMQIQLQNQTIGLSVSYRQPVIFDRKIRCLSPFISYNGITGEIKIIQTGVYYINWWVAIDSVVDSQTDESTTFGIISSAGDNILASYPTLLSLQISGNALISITASPCDPVTLQLVNLTQGIAGFGVAPVRADLTIINVIY